LKCAEGCVIENLSYMFSGCKYIQSILAFFNLIKMNVTNMSYIFDGCLSLEKLCDISRLDTSNVEYV